MNRTHVFMRRALPGALAWLLAAGGALAAPLVFSGRLDDPGNTALVDSDLQPPSFTDPYNNVALYDLNIARAGNVSFTSTGYAAGGVDPYFSLFRGIGTSAGFLASNYDNAFLGPGGDFVIALALSAGDYVIAIGAFGNESRAENFGGGVLGDGFSRLGFGLPGGDTTYRLLVDTAAGGGSVPEPAGLGLALVALTALAGVRRVAR